MYIDKRMENISYFSDNALVGFKVHIFVQLKLDE